MHALGGVSGGTLPTHKYGIIIMGSLSCSSGSPWLSETIQSLMEISAGRYRYMRDLDRCHPLSDVAPLRPRGPFPIWLPALLPFMWCHSDQDTYIFHGLSQGFRIGFNRRCQLQGSRQETIHQLVSPIGSYYERSAEWSSSRAAADLPLPAHSW